MKRTAMLAEELDVRLHTHLAKTTDETRYCAEIYGCRPLDYIEQNGWLSSRVWVAHGVHFSPAETAPDPRRGLGRPLPMQQPTTRSRPLSGCAIF
jgi:8-oxoguanine deaminase